jgi:hypothetical protein
MKDTPKTQKIWLFVLLGMLSTFVPVIGSMLTPLFFAVAMHFSERYWLRRTGVYLATIVITGVLTGVITAFYGESRWTGFVLMYGSLFALIIQDIYRARHKQNKLKVTPNAKQAKSPSKSGELVLLVVLGLALAVIVGGFLFISLNTY